MILPHDDRSATQASEVRMTYDNKNIYISVIFFNNTIRGDYVVESYKRDFSFGKNDNFLVAIDPFNASFDDIGIYIFFFIKNPYRPSI